MGRRDKSKDKSSHKESSADTEVVEGSGQLEPYTCKGKFNVDFAELCMRAEISPPPILRSKAKLLATGADRTQSDTKQEKLSKAKSKEKETASNLTDESEDHPEEIKEPPPKTYVVKDKFEFFKPTIQCDMDNEKWDTVGEMNIKGWKICDRMMTVLQQALPMQEKLHTINLWNVGFTEDTLNILAKTLPQCRLVKNLALEGTPMPSQTYADLIAQDSLLQHLSLRYNHLNDEGIRLLSLQLATSKEQNNKLLTLNLNGNCITDQGASHLAKALRLNRTLLSLSLGSNKIGDTGACAIAKSLAIFALTHEEIVERRYLLEKMSQEQQKSASPPSRRGDKHRPGSKESLSEKRKALSKRKDQKGKDDREDTHSKTKTRKDDKGKKEKTTGKVGFVKTTPPETPSSTDDEQPDGSGDTLKEKTKSGQGKTRGGRSESSRRATSQSELSNQEAVELQNPLLGEAIEHDGDLMLKGNMVLININLANNNIGNEAVDEFCRVVEEHERHSKFNLGNGLLRLALNKNDFDEQSPKYQKLQELMQKRDPMNKPVSRSSSHRGGSSSPTKSERN